MYVCILNIQVQVAANIFNLQVSDVDDFDPDGSDKISAVTVSG